MPNKCWCEVEEPRLTEALPFCSWTTQNTWAQRLLWQKKRESEGPQVTFMASSRKWHAWIPPTTHWPHSVIFSTSGELRKCGLPLCSREEVYGHPVLSLLHWHSKKKKKNTDFVVVSTWLYILWHLLTMQSPKVLVFSNKMVGLIIFELLLRLSFWPKFYLYLQV